MHDFTAIDFETANAKRPSICQVGLVRVEASEIVQELEWLVRPPGNRYHAAHTSIHGIDASATQGAPSFACLWPEIRLTA